MVREPMRWKIFGEAKIRSYKFIWCGHFLVAAEKLECLLGRPIGVMWLRSPIVNGECLAFLHSRMGTFHIGAIMATTIFLGVSVVAMVAYYIWDINKLAEEWYNWEDIRDEAF